MSEPKRGPFREIGLTGTDWVIFILKVVRTINEGYGAHQSWIDEAIAVLEAAGKVRDALMRIIPYVEAKDGMGYFSGDLKILQRLLEVLPDKP